MAPVQPNPTRTTSTDGNFFATQFYADVEGHPEDTNLKLALEELRFFTKEVRILGVYKGSDIRDTHLLAAE